MEHVLHPRVKNSTGQKFPAIFYGKHFTAGVAEYADGANGQPYRVYISEETAKQMDPSFATCPIYCDHVDSENANKESKTVEGITKDEKGNEKTKIADGYVLESFFLPVDGAHWCKFIITSQQGVDAIKAGDQLSNCYTPISLGPGGSWHGVEYSREFLDASYNHLAIVKNPRYKESVVLTPEQFKAYCEEKTTELAALRNSADPPKKFSIKPIFKGVSAMSILDKLFGKNAAGKLEKIENAAEVGNIVVSLGKGKKTTIGALIKNADMLSTDINDWDQAAAKDRTEHNADEEDEEDPLKKKNRKKSDAADMDEDKENEDLVKKGEDVADRPEHNDEEDLADLKDKKNRKKASAEDEDMENDDADDAKMKALREKQNRKKSDLEDLEKEKNGDEFSGRGKGGEKDFVGNDDADTDPLKNVINMDGEDTTVGEMINAHVELKNKYNTLRQKHNDLKEAYNGMRNKFGDDEDMEVPNDDDEAKEALNGLEEQEKALQNSLEKRRGTIERIIGKMKNSQEAIAKREAKKQEGLEHMKRLQNAELEKMLNGDEVASIGTETSSSMVERGKSRYGSGN
jgi:hypothetical protein